MGLLLQGGVKAHPIDGSLSTNLEIPGAGSCQLFRDAYDPDIAILRDLTVYPSHRGNKLGSQLFEAAVELAREQDCTDFQAEAANERTAKCFHRFDEKDLDFAKYDLGTKQYYPLEISLDGVIKHLKRVRGAMPKTLREDHILPVSILINARLQ